mgnify:CR=1 FL=1
MSVQVDSVVFDTAAVLRNSFALLRPDEHALVAVQEVLACCEPACCCETLRQRGQASACDADFVEAAAAAIEEAELRRMPDDAQACVPKCC